MPEETARSATCRLVLRTLQDHLSWAKFSFLGLSTSLADSDRLNSTRCTFLRGMLGLLRGGSRSLGRGDVKPYLLILSVAR